MISDLVSYLADGVVSFVTVELAYSMQPIEDLADETPAAYLYLANESASVSDYDGAVVQEVTKTVNVFIVCKHAHLEDLRAELRALLLAWQYDDYHTPLEFLGGEAAQIKGEFCWWSESYQTRTQYRST